MKTTLCHYNGCYATALPGKHYCLRHIQMEAQWGKGFRHSRRTKSNEWHSLYSSARWRTTSREFLKKYPVCCRCGKPARVADHIKPHRGEIELFYDETNLQPLCQSCHSAKIMAENNFYKSKRQPSKGYGV